MGLLTTHHLMQMLLCTWGQPWASYCPGWTTGDGPCPLSPLVFLITFLFLFFVYLQNAYLDEHTKIKCLLRNIYIKLATVYNLSVESSFSLYFLQSFSFLLMAYLVIHFPPCLSIFPFRFILMKNKMCPSFRISSAVSTFQLSGQCPPHKNPHSPGSPIVGYPSIFSFAGLHVCTDLVFSSTAISIAHGLNFLNNMQTQPLFPSSHCSSCLFILLPMKLLDKLIKNCVWVWELHRLLFFYLKRSHSLLYDFTGTFLQISTQLCWSGTSWILNNLSNTHTWWDTYFLYIIPKYSAILYPHSPAPHMT